MAPASLKDSRGEVAAALSQLVSPAVHSWLVSPPGCIGQRGIERLRDKHAPWAGFHTFRHTFASLHLSEGTNLLQLSRALGHHLAAFTLSRYTHLLPGDEAPALDLTSTPATSDLPVEAVA